MSHTAGKWCSKHSQYAHSCTDCIAERPAAGKTHVSEYQERNPAIEKALREIGTLLKAKMPEGCGFILQIFTYGEGGSLFYISTAEREDAINLMKEQIKRFGGGDGPTSPTAG